jgi:hypothetical protein
MKYIPTLHRKSLLCIGAASLLSALALQASPAIRITKEPQYNRGIMPLNFKSGPDEDPYATKGIAMRNTNGTLSYRIREFHDERDGRAIFGYVSRVFPDSGPLTSFAIKATITNDLIQIPPTNIGSNVQGEYRTRAATGVVPLTDAVLCVEFASAYKSFLQPFRVSPYAASSIKATNNDQFIFYNGGGPGSFKVPGWSFGTIPHNQSSKTITLWFSCNLPATDAFNLALRKSFKSGTDILSNPLSALKIYAWPNVTTNSSASVFHN